MKFHFDKQKTAYLLFIVVLVLIVADLSIKKFFLNSSEEEVVEISEPSEIDEKFFTILKNFGIDDKLIRRKETSNKEKKLPLYTYTVTVPLDLPIPVILGDIFSEYSGKNFEIISKEIESGGKSSVQIIYDDRVIIKADLQYSEDIIRQKGRIGIMINQFALESQQDSLIFDIPESFCILLQPSKENSKKAGFIQKKNKEFAVLIDDNIVELDFKLKGDYSAQRIKNIIRTIVGSFSSAKFFVFDEQSDFFGSDGYKIVLSELGKRKIKHTTLKKFVNLVEASSTAAINDFEEIIKELGPHGQKIILVNKNEFSELLPSIAFFRKSGVKFINPSIVVL
jgi:hypothetical protein